MNVMSELQTERLLKRAELKGSVHYDEIVDVLSRSDDLRQVEIKNVIGRFTARGITFLDDNGKGIRCNQRTGSPG